MAFSCISPKSASNLLEWTHNKLSRRHSVRCAMKTKVQFLQFLLNETSKKAVWWQFANCGTLKLLKLRKKIPSSRLTTISCTFASIFSCSPNCGDWSWNQSAGENLLGGALKNSSLRNASSRQRSDHQDWSSCDEVAQTVLPHRAQRFIIERNVKGNALFRVGLAVAALHYTPTWHVVQFCLKIPNSTSISIKSYTRSSAKLHTSLIVVILCVGKMTSRRSLQSPLGIIDLFTAQEKQRSKSGTSKNNFDKRFGRIVSGVLKIVFDCF